MPDISISKEFSAEVTVEVVCKCGESLDAGLFTYHRDVTLHECDFHLTHSIGLLLETRPERSSGGLSRRSWQRGGW